VDYQSEVHRAICTRVRRLLTGEVTQRDLADLLECDVSSINRALLLTDRGERHRQRQWRAWEVYAVSDMYGASLQHFFPRNRP
jgi:hypothetical protein